MVDRWWTEESCPGGEHRSSASRTEDAQRPEGDARWCRYEIRMKASMNDQEEGRRTESATTSVVWSMGSTAREARSLRASPTRGCVSHHQDGTQIEIS